LSSNPFEGLLLLKTHHSVGGRLAPTATIRGQYSAVKTYSLFKFVQEALRIALGTSARRPQEKPTSFKASSQTTGTTAMHAKNENKPYAI
jgi:hypothetical protein